MYNNYAIGVKGGVMGPSRFRKFLDIIHIAFWVLFSGNSDRVVLMGIRLPKETENIRTIGFHVLSAMYNAGLGATLGHLGKQGEVRLPVNSKTVRVGHQVLTFKFEEK